MKSWWRKEEAAAVAAAGTGAEPAASSPNPYLDGRRAWNSHVDRAYAAQHTWQLLCVVCLLVALGAVGGMIYIGSKSKFVPYVIEVNKLGEAVAVGPAQVAGPADPRVVRASLASFIASARLVTPDVSLQREAVFRVYAMLHTKDPAAQQMNEWYNGSKDSTPFARAAKVTVTTDINSVLPMSGNSWQVDWQETTRDRTGALVGPIQDFFKNAVNQRSDEGAVINYSIIKDNWCVVSGVNSPGF